MPALFRNLLGLGMLTAGLALGLYSASPRGHRPAPALVADRLFLGRAIPGGGLVSEDEWSAFLRDVVTPRFPDGLTVWRAEGQWADPRGGPVREPVVVLELVHPAGPRADASLAAIAGDYRRRFRQGAVLRVSTPASGLIYGEGPGTPGR